MIYHRGVMKNVFWVASYPRSGNTWMRGVLAHLLFGPGTYRQVLDPYQQPDLEQARAFNLHGQPTIAVKTHAAGYPDKWADQTRPAGALYLYRHPLDVLLSAINFNFIHDNEQFFKNRQLKRVEQIRAGGELGYYLDRFGKKLDLRCFHNMAGSWLENMEAWHEMAEQDDRIHIARYEDLVAQPVATLTPVARFLGVSDDRLHEALEAGGAQMQGGNGFFWSKKGGNYRELFSPEQIQRFVDRHGATLEKYGYEEYRS